MSDRKSFYRLSDEERVNAFTAVIWQRLFGDFTGLDLMEIDFKISDDEANILMSPFFSTLDEATLTSDQKDILMNGFINYSRALIRAIAQTGIVELRIDLSK